MRKRLMYSIVAMLSLATVFTSCNNDDEKTPTPAREIAKEYKEAIVTNNSKTIADAVVTLDAIDDNNVKVTLTNVVAGYPTFEVNALVVATKSTTHTFVGEKEADGVKVTVKGSIVDGNAVVDVAVKITSGVVGKWTYNITGSSSMDAFAVNYTNIGDSVMYVGKMIPCSEYSTNIADLLGLVAGMAVNPVELEFKDNGYISGKISLTEMVGVPQDIPFNDVARYTFDTKTGVLTIDAEINIEDSPFTGSLPIPFKMELKKDDKMEATLGWDFIKQLTPLIPEGAELEELLSSLDDLIPPGLESFFPIKTMIRDVINSLSANGAKLDLTMKLQKIK